jgi:hypothetical protein
VEFRGKDPSGHQAIFITFQGLHRKQIKTRNELTMHNYSDEMLYEVVLFVLWSGHQWMN